MTTSVRILDIYTLKTYIIKMTTYSVVRRRIGGSIFKSSYVALGIMSFIDLK
jgi:hypothetical protein